MPKDVRPVYIGNFEYDASSREIEKMCEKYGDLQRVDMKTGFAFVYYEDERDAEKAVRGLDGREFGFKRRRLRVEWSKRREETRKGNVEPADTLFVVNFNVEDTQERDLEKFFGKFGRLTRVQIRRTYAFVQFESVDQATEAQKETHLSRFMGRTISVEFVSKDSGPRGGGGARDRDGGRGRYRSRSRSPVQRPRSRSPSYGRDSPRRSYSRSPRRSYSRSPRRSFSRSPARGRSRSISPARSYSR